MCLPTFIKLNQHKTDSRWKGWRYSLVNTVIVKPVSNQQHIWGVSVSLWQRSVFAQNSTHIWAKILGEINKTISLNKKKACVGSHRSISSKIPNIKDVSNFEVGWVKSGSKHFLKFANRLKWINLSNYGR